MGSSSDERTPRDAHDTSNDHRLDAAAAALASLATVLALPAGGSAVIQERPSNTVEPRISGTAAVGVDPHRDERLVDELADELRLPVGALPALGRPGRTAPTVPRSAAPPTSSYVVATADVDRRLRVRVTASNADGNATVASNATAVIANPDAGRPRNVQPPTISGTPSQGQTLHVTPGTWTGQPITFTFNWLRCDGAGNNCVQQAGFNDDAYVLREGDVGKTIRARVNARNSRGDGSRLTAQTAVVTGPQGPAGVITLPNGEKSIPATSVPPTTSGSSSTR